MPVVTYSLLRLGVFALALVGLALAGMGSWLLVVVAAVVAAALSYVVLGKQRVAAARWLEDRRTGGPRFSQAVQDDAAAEDALAEQWHAETEHAQTDPAKTDDRPDAPGDQIASPNPSSTP